MHPTFSHVVGFDDAPFPRLRRGPVLTIGVAMSDTRIDGILSTTIWRDGANSTPKIAECVNASRFSGHLQLILFQGIALGGFNVLDLAALRAATGLPVLVVARKAPNLEAIRSALLHHVPGGARKWRLIEQAGPMEPCGDLFVQREGLDLPQAAAVLHRFALHGFIPEPLRLAHLIGGGVALGQSRGRA
jgi:endonuclease V-like protein UPF0215 family